MWKNIQKEEWKLTPKIKHTKRLHYLGKGWAFPQSHESWKKEIEAYTNLHSTEVPKS